MEIDVSYEVLVELQYFELALVHIDKAADQAE